MAAHRLEPVTTLEVVRRVDAWARSDAAARARGLELNGLRSLS
jgi:hypothetical protein